MQDNGSLFKSCATDYSLIPRLCTSEPLPSAFAFAWQAATPDSVFFIFSSSIYNTLEMHFVCCNIGLLFSFGCSESTTNISGSSSRYPNLSSFLTGVSCSDWRCSSRDALQKHCCEICARIQHPHWTFQPIPAAIGVPRLYPIQVLHWRNVAQYLSRGKLCSTNNYHCII